MVLCTEPAPEAVRDVREVGALWLLEACDASELLAEASRASGECDPSPELVELAILYSSTSWWELKDALDACLIAYGFEALDPRSPLVPVLALRRICRLFLAGTIDVAVMLGAAHSLVGHHGHRSAHKLVELCDLVDDEAYVSPLEPGEIEREAAEFLRQSTNL